MPISEPIARRQIKRFTDFAQFPGPDGIRELVKAFVEVSQNADQAESIGDELMRTMHFCPKPADVHEAAERVLQRKFAGHSESEEWQSQRQPGDEPFNGLADLIDDDIRAALERAKNKRKTGMQILSERKQPAKAAGGAA